MSARAIRIWDPLIRVFHWSLALFFLLNYFVTEEGEDWHRWIGYSAAALVAARLIWGFVGPANARFANFLPTPARLRHHLGELRSGSMDLSSGHNPLGAAMIVLLLLLIASLGLTGYMMTEIDYFWGEAWLEDLHAVLADVAGAAVVVHVSAVLVMQRYFRTQLIVPMITGSRRVPAENSTAKIND